jgi:disabled family protein 2
MSTSKFKGSGINFNAKLLGVAEVSETRNEKMCQDAITHLKLSLLNSGEHKQKILVKVSLSGLLIVDVKTNVSRIQFHILGWVGGRG